MNVDTFTDPYSQITLSQHGVRVFFFVFAAPVILSGGVLIEEVQG